MLTRSEEDIAILEIEEKNDEILIEWILGKEGNRNAERTATRQVAGERSGTEGAEVAEGTSYQGAEQGTPADAAQNAEI